MINTNLNRPYTKDQVIEDGFLIDFSKVARDVGFHLPFAITTKAWECYILWVDEDTTTCQTIQNIELHLWKLLHRGYCEYINILSK